MILSRRAFLVAGPVAATYPRLAAVAASAGSDFANSVNTVHHQVSIGQSLEEGYNTNGVATPSPLDAGRAKMFSIGVRLLGNGQEPAHKLDAVDPATLSSLVDLRAMQQGLGGQTSAPTFAHGRLAALSNGHGYLCSNVAVGSTSITDRARGTAIYRNLLAGVEAGKRLVQRAGRVYVITELITKDGEQDSSSPGVPVTAEYWMTAKLKESAAINEDVKAITGQTEDVITVTWQASYNAKPNQLAQLQLALDHPQRFICVGPKFHLTPSRLHDGTRDPLHIDAASQARCGYEEARAVNIFRATGHSPIPPHIANARLDKASLILSGEFVGYIEGGMAIDTDLVSNMADGNYGLKFVQAGGGDVSIVRGSVRLGTRNSFTCQLDRLPTGTDWRLLCGRHLDDSRAAPLSGPDGNSVRNCFRDQSTDSTPPILGKSYPMYRWAAQWETPVSAI